MIDIYKQINDRYKQMNNKELRTNKQRIHKSMIQKTKMEI